MYKPFQNIQGKWLSMWTIPFISKDGDRKGLWEMCGRKEPTLGKKTYGGVVIIATAKDKETGEKMVLIEKIYRIPVRKYVLEFPAGMRDPDEDDAIKTGLRELKEETGYKGHNARKTVEVKTDAWKSTGVHIHVL